MRKFKLVQGIALTFLGTWSLAFGMEKCSVALETSNKTFVEEACTLLSTSASMGGICVQKNENALQELKRSCTSFEGFETECTLMNSENKRKSGAILQRKQTYDRASETMKVTWELDREEVDIEKPIRVAFRYRAEDPVKARVIQKERDISLQLHSVQANSLCMSDSVEMSPIKRQTNRYFVEIIVRAPYDALPELDALVILYSGEDSNIDSPAVIPQGNAPAVANESKQLVYEENICIDFDADSCNRLEENCSCTGGFYVEPKKVYLIVFFLCILLLAASAACFIKEYKYRQQQENPSRVGDESDLRLPSPTSRGARFLRFSLLSSKASDQRDDIEGKDLEQAKSNSLPKDVKRVQLRDLLQDVAKRERFAAFLESKGAQELWMFFDSMETFQKLPSRQWRVKESGEILSRFVADDAPYKVELSASVRAKLLSATDRGAKGFFEEGALEIYNKLQINYLEAFLLTVDGQSSPEEDEAYSLRIA